MSVSPQGPESLTNEQTPDLREYLRPVWRRRWLILAIVVLATAATYFLASRHESSAHQPKQYATSTEVYIEVADPVSLIGSGGTAPNPPDGQQMSDIANLFTAGSVTNAVYKALGMPVGSAGSVDVNLLNTGSAATYGTSIIVVQTTSNSPTLAARLANAYVAQFLASRKRAEAGAATAQADAARAQLDTIPNTSANASERRSLSLQIAQLRETALNPSAGAYQVSPATVPTAALPVAASRKPIVYAAIGGVVALLLAIALAYGLSLFDRRIMRVSSVEASYRRSVLAVLPHVSMSAPKADARAVVPPEFVESLRSLRINLRLLRDGAAPRTLLITSAVPGEGKSTLAVYLALVCMESGERVLLIDGDLRRPRISSWFGIESKVGLTQVLRGEATLAEALVAMRRPRPERSTENGSARAAPPNDPSLRGALDVLAHGELLDNPAPLLATQAAAATLATVSRHYDVVIIDTAPVLAVADAVPLLGIVDAVLVVARVGVTTRDAAERLTEAITRVPKANLLGVVANDVRDTFLDDGYGGAYSGGRYGYGSHNGNGNGHGVRRRWLSRAR